ncbi:hypothetical protein GJ744_000294 [Endocarpon pusillum]|uniref:Uncharacterized protein n=1 Tax=Endocarpon pusillum TaxID=364733 RepID=A0A8H7E842_9EURO|nr:hypothetical protein GJ744_000294 [Endocarpon pusillum]
MLKSPDKTYWTAPALLASIVELDVGIIAGCMPVIQVTLIRRFAKISQLSPFRCLTRRLFRARSEATTGGVVEYGPDLTGNGYGRPYLETEILHGADGEGNFMSSVRAQTDPQSSWLSFPFRAMGTRTRGQSNKNNPTAAGTLRSDHGGLVTNYVSSAGSSHIDREEEPNRHYMVHVQDIENVV